MRKKERAIIDFETIQALVKSCHVLRLALFDEEYPYIVPVNFGYEWIAQKLVLYIHGSQQGKKISCIEKNNRVAIEMDCKHRLIEADSNASQYSYAYQSLIGFGQGTLVEETSEKIHGLDLLMTHETGRGLQSYDPLSEKMLRVTGIIKIDIEHFTCKENLHPDEK